MFDEFILQLLEFVGASDVGIDLGRIRYVITVRAPFAAGQNG
jgi:hypothetical protein